MCTRCCFSFSAAWRERCLFLLPSTCCYAEAMPSRRALRRQCGCVVLCRSCLRPCVVDAFLLLLPRHSFCGLHRGCLDWLHVAAHHYHRHATRHAPRPAAPHVCNLLPFVLIVDIIPVFRGFNRRYALATNTHDSLPLHTVSSLSYPYSLVSSVECFKCWLSAICQLNGRKVTPCVFYLGLWGKI